jgi:release factor glutamine methyltransferase
MDEAELLFTEILNCDRLSLYLDRKLPLDKQKSGLVSSVLKRRMRGEPLQYILGKTEFMGLEFRVNKEVLIPRQETEILVETVIRKVRESAPACPAGRSLRVMPLRILDIGTGSGCIAISLAKFLPQAEIYAMDISIGALKIAKENARLHDVNINCIHSDLFSSNELLVSGYDYIVSNPPYIPASQILRLQREIKYEPLIALDGKSDGLDYYRRIINDAYRYLKEGGLLILEIGFNQARHIENIFQKSGNFEIIDKVKDYNGIDRMVVARVRNAWIN